MADVLDKEQKLDEAIAAAFAKPVESGQLVPLPNVTVADAIITAQKVAVERDEAKVLHRIRVMAAEVGEGWFYRYPVRNNRTGQTDWIEGPSIKCANNVARMYGNCQIDTRIVDNGDSWIIYARFTDYETGFSYTRPFQQRKGQQSIKSKDSDRSLDIALQIGISKAIRNVVCNALETFTNFAFDEAKASIVAKVGQNLERYRDRVIARLTELGVELHRVEAATGRASKDWLAPDVARVITQLQAVNDGMATIDETWPPGAAPPRPTRDEYTGNTTEAQPEPIEVFDLTGVAIELPSLEKAVEQYRAFLDEGERQQGEAGLKLIWDNNTYLMRLLDERGQAELSKELSLEYGKRRQSAANKGMAEREAAEAKTVPTGTATEAAGGSPASQTAGAPTDTGATASAAAAPADGQASLFERDSEFWGRADGKRTITAPDPARFILRLRELLPQCRSWAETDDIERHNRMVISKFAATERGTVAQLFAARREELRGQ